MNEQLALLMLAPVAVGVLHTIVPDHWAPIALIARQRGWSLQKTARTAAIAGVGHTLSTLLIGIVVWLAGAVVALRFGHLMSLISSVALIGFGAWIVFGSLRELREHDRAHGHPHAHDHGLEDALATDRGAASSRLALLLIVGSSPMVEGIPAFFAASRYGIAILTTMALLFAISTIATYVAVCIASVRALNRFSFGGAERYGEVVSGGFIVLVGIIFAVWPIS